MGEFKVNWSALYSARKEIKRKFPNIWKLPIVKKELSILKRLISDNTKILEIGAGDRSFSKKLAKLNDKITYQSYDIDKLTFQDFYSLDEINGRYDLIFGFELIEHLSPGDGLKMLSRLRSNLAPSGKILLGTPNLYHPHRYFGDLTHVTPYKYEELGALLSLANYKVIAIYRMYNNSTAFRFLKVYLFWWIHKWLDIDFAQTILVVAAVAEKNPEQEAPNLVV